MTSNQLWTFANVTVVIRHCISQFYNYKQWNVDFVTALYSCRLYLLLGCKTIHHHKVIHYIIVRGILSSKWWKYKIQKCIRPSSICPDISDWWRLSEYCIIFKYLIRMIMPKFDLVHETEFINASPFLSSKSTLLSVDPYENATGHRFLM